MKGHRMNAKTNGFHFACANGNGRRVAALLLASAVAFFCVFGLLGDLAANAAEDISVADRVSAAEAAVEVSRAVGQSAVSLSVPALLQNPELPTGCESVALTDLLLFYGFDLEKTTIADYWLPTSSTDFVYAFLGDPHDASSHACLAPCIVQTANEYLSAQGSQLAAYELTGASFSEVLANVEEGYPVIIWATVDLKDPGDEPYLTQWANDRLYGLFANNHCMVVSGYDAGASTVTVSDPLEGTVDYDMGLLAQRFVELGSQAVLIA